MIPSISLPLGVLTNAFYHDRFGSNGNLAGSETAGTNDQPDPAVFRQDDIQQALDDLIKSVDLMTTSSTSMEQSE